jgi:uncharacterized integral membrane protein
MNYVKLCAFVLILAVSFVSENTQPVALRYHFNVEIPSFAMYLLIFIPFFIGIVMGSLVGFGDRPHLKDTVKRLSKSNMELDEKLKQIQEAQIPSEYETGVTAQKSTDAEIIPAREGVTR